jgi:hypothetical protein
MMTVAVEKLICGKMPKIASRLDGPINDPQGATDHLLPPNHAVLAKIEFLTATPVSAS